MLVRPKIKKKMCVSGYPTMSNFLPPTLIFLSTFRGFPRDFQGRGILFPHLLHVKTLNKIKTFPTYHLFFFISCNLKHTYFFFGRGGGGGGLSITNREDIDQTSEVV